jgi:hypothetical protein
MSRETTQEASAVHTKQLQYDRQIADMSLTISKLQAILREAEKEPSGESGDFCAGIGMPHGPHALMQQQQQLTNLADVGSVEIKPEAAQAPP